eukprot:1544447-Amphidinium_carterae.1
MVRLEDVRITLVPNWPESETPWRGWLRREMMKNNQQCLFPEVPRVAFSILTCSDAGFKCSADTEAARWLSARSVLNSQQVVGLGDLQRLEEKAYHNLFLLDWPAGQGLHMAKVVPSLSDLESYLGYTTFAALQD